MSELGYAAFDADNHYYEAQDAFTRHVPRQMQARCVQWATIEGRQHHIVGGKLARAVRNPTWNPISLPGSIAPFLHGKELTDEDVARMRASEPLPDYYMNRDARVAKLEQQELEWALTRGATVVCMRPAAVTLADGSRVSPADARFDPFWSRLNEAGITLVIHAADSGYTTHGYVSDGFSSDFNGGVFSPNIKHFNIERAAYDFLITLAYEKLFERFPGLRIASIENGAEYLPDLFRKLGQSRDRMRGYYNEDPAELFRRHVWINPFWEDDVNEVARYMGIDRVIFGSDWPHIEGMETPLDYLADLEDFDAGARQKIMRDNTRFLNTPQPG